MVSSLALQKYSTTTKFAGAKRRITVLGSTGTIGVNTLDLVARNPEAYEVVALSANQNIGRLAEQAIQFNAKLAVSADPARYQELKNALAGTDIEVAAGKDSLIEAASKPADWIMAAIVGAAGLRPTLAAVRQGSYVALANKECLVSAGSLFAEEVRKSGTILLPVDSEHSAIFQIILGHPENAIEKMVLTASGGPFREWSLEQLKQAKPSQALKHPNWSMGQKITIDSATLMNKGLEVIEAWHLFPVEADKLDILVHPQSIIHGLVSYSDGSVIAQMGSPDMRTPIAYSLSWPDRMEAPTKRLDLAELGRLTFDAPDEKRFPSLRIAREVLKDECRQGAVLNAANEIAVEAFLANRIGFMSIPALIDKALELFDKASTDESCKHDLDEIIQLDEEVRIRSRSLLKSFEIS